LIAAVLYNIKLLFVFTILLVLRLGWYAYVEYYIWARSSAIIQTGSYSMYLGIVGVAFQIFYVILFGYFSYLFFQKLKGDHRAYSRVPTMESTPINQGNEYA